MASQFLAPFRARPRMVGAIGVGLAVALALRFIPNELRWSTRAIFSWDAGAIYFICACVLLMVNQAQKEIQQRAAGQDEGRGMILALVTIAASASLAAIAVELSLAHHEKGIAQVLRVGLGVTTVALSWFLVQLIYALHYAHEYYGAVDGQPKSLRGGLFFPGKEPPDYWDFLHFSVVIGVAAQTADIAFTSKTMRRTGTIHSVFAFVFNTVVLALTINLVAGLF
jgi:uncharacterized membrane protein